MWWLSLAVAHAAAPSFPDGDCRCFDGQVVGNDTVTAGFRLCRQGDAVNGGFDWAGARSGRSFRVLEGRMSWDPPGLRLEDRSLPVAQANAGWRFCAIDRYTLSFTPTGGLEGTFASAACADQGTVRLAPVACRVEAPADPPPAVVKGPRPELVPDEVQACRERGFLWLSDPDYYERTELEVDGVWTPAWQVLDRQGGRLGHLLVWPRDCRVVVGIVTPVAGGPPTFEIVPPPTGPATDAEVRMLRRWAGLER